LRRHERLAGGIHIIRDRLAVNGRKIMTEPIILLPYPRSLAQNGGQVNLLNSRLIALEGAPATDLLYSARRAQAALREYAALNWEIVGSTSVPHDSIGLFITVNSAVQHAECYQLTINQDAITILAHDPAGAFYGVMTLVQLLQQYGGNLPALVIKDYPDLANRGVMLDISRDKIPTMETLYSLIDKFANWKINQLQLYTEHTFAYRNHPEVWATASPITAEQVLELDAYCKERFIDLVPNQNSFGHMHRWFEHDRYKPMAEAIEGFVAPNGEFRKYSFSLNPSHPESLKLVDSLFDELLPNFSSRYFNVNCDETFDLGQGMSKALCEEKGIGQVYLDFLLEIYTRVKRRKLTMQFWGDIIGHYPNLVSQLPKDAIALEWGYEAEHDFPEKCAQFAESGIPFFVCPGTSAWNSIAGRTENAIGNIRSAVENGLKYGASGILNTDWGDRGHWQTLPVSYLGFAYGAALGWCYEANVNIDLPAVLNTFVFEDKANVMGKLAYDLGNAYLQPDFWIHNGSLLFWAYHHPVNFLNSEVPTFWQERQQLLKSKPNMVNKIKQSIEYIDQVMAPLESAQIGCSDAETITNEFQLAAKMLKHGANRLLLMFADPAIDLSAVQAERDAIERQYRAQWLVRNRPGGLEDSLARLTNLHGEPA
jgi:hexosaminidase